MRARDHQQAAVAGEDIVEIGKDDEVVAEDAALAKELGVNIEELK